MRIGWNGGGHHRSLEAATDLRVGTLCPTPQEERTRALLRALCAERSEPA